MSVKKALTVAGSDSGGGAGIQADLKTFQELGVYGMSVITAITAQNTLGVHGVHPIPLDMVEQQMDAIAEDMGTDALKTGMLFSSELIETVAKKIKQHGWRNLVVDPVMVAKGGSRLLQEEAVAALKTHLIPLARLVTPNIPEAQVLTGRTLDTIEDRKEAARHIFQMGAQHVMIKGGHVDGDMSIDLFFDGQHFIELSAKRIDTGNTHGTGCTFAAAATAALAAGASLEQAVRQAKSFIQAAIEHALSIGKGHGPTNHWAYGVAMDGKRSVLGGGLYDDK